ncbi:hypothetical protein [Fictibacillus sp. S7]|uniref:hypothetical protein n=1 Tax=Fictibacillus sp. S7 TaxID=2212476 RepID=UPI0019D6F57E|nr:hypothetical protein [Fictibacillus sp. S7]
MRDSSRRCGTGETQKALAPIGLSARPAKVGVYAGKSEHPEAKIHIPHMTFR